MLACYERRSSPRAEGNHKRESDAEKSAHLKALGLGYLRTNTSGLCAGMTILIRVLSAILPVQVASTLDANGQGYGRGDVTTVL